MKLSLLCAVLALLPACPPTPSPPTPVPVDAADICAAACDRMRALSCSGIRDTCASTLAKLEADRLMRAPSGQPITCACLASASSRAGIEACGIACAGP